MRTKTAFLLKKSCAFIQKKWQPSSVRSLPFNSHQWQEDDLNGSNSDNWSPATDGGQEINGILEQYIQSGFISKIDTMWKIDFSHNFNSISVVQFNQILTKHHYGCLQLCKVSI